MDNIEIERKFLVTMIPDNLSIISKKVLYQGYVAIGDDSSEIRIRKKGDEYFLTHKEGNGLIRKECEFNISIDLFNALWPLTLGKRVLKERSQILQDQNLIELDVFIDRKDTLIIAEVEFKTSDESHAFVLPHWFGEEITENLSYRNQNLAC
jgi:CYTH domain-containing protein